MPQTNDALNVIRDVLAESRRATVDLRPKQRQDAELACEKSALLAEKETLAGALAAGDVNSAPAFAKRRRAIDDRISEIDAIRTALQADIHIPAEERDALQAELEAGLAAQRKHDEEHLQPAKKRMQDANTEAIAAEKHLRAMEAENAHLGVFGIGQKIRQHREAYPQLYTEAQS